MKKRVLSILCTLALCLTLLPVAAEATEWEHSDHSSWTALTSDELIASNYALSSGKYYLSGVDMGGGMYALTLEQSITIPDGANVTLCLNDVYCFPGFDSDYSPVCDAAIIVQEGGMLTVCDCSSNSSGSYLGGSGSMGGTGPAIENHGTLNIVSGNIGYGSQYPVIDNKEGATLSLGGSPDLYYITSAGTVSASCEGIPFTGSSYYNYYLYIDYTGDLGNPVVTNVTDDNYALFLKPDGGNFTYNAQAGTLTMEAPVTYGSLVFAGSQTVGDGVYYQIYYDKVVDSYSGNEYYAVYLRDGDEDDYNLLWDEESKTLTLRDAEVIFSATSFQNHVGSLFSLTEGTLSVNLIGENEITVYSDAAGIAQNAHAFESQDGDLIFQGDGSLAVTMLPGTEQTGNIDMTGIIAAGNVENQAVLTISGSPGGLTWSGDMTGVSCDSFTNSGTLDIEFSDLSNGVGVIVDGGTFDNSGVMDIQFAEMDGVGIHLMQNTSSFRNSGSITVDISASDSAQGILRYGSQTENNFTWINTAAGWIAISVSGQGTAAASLGGGALAGLDLRSGGNIHFTNNGTLEVTAESESPVSLNKSNWPSWQYFDTVGLLLLADTCTLTNTGTMDLTALNGYTAGISVSADGYDISIANSGTMDITTTTQGGENIRSVGIYAQLPDMESGITDGQAKELPFTMKGNTIHISTSAADGFTVENDMLMGICLVQTFEGNVPSDLNSLQQINAEGMALPGEPVVIKVDNDGTGKTAFINTIGTVAADGTVIPVTDMTVLPLITGTVSISGSTLAGSTLTAQVTGLPSDATVSYQWQVSDRADGPFTDLAGETGTALLLTSGHMGKYIRLVVTPTDGIYGGTLTAVTDSRVSYSSSSDSSSYSIKLDIGDHGSVHSSHRAAEEEETVTLTVTPDNGYMLKDLTVTDSNGKTVKLTSKDSDRYTFEMPARTVTVTAEFVPDSLSASPFTDVAETHWAYDEIAWTYENGYMSGTTVTTFNPGGAVTRQQVWMILARMSGTYPADMAEAKAWAVANGISDGTNPGSPVTRQQLAAMLYRYAVQNGMAAVTLKENLSAYPDAADVSSYAVQAMNWAVGEGIITGTTQGTLNPAGTATRAQLAVMLCRWLA